MITIVNGDSTCRGITSEGVNYSAVLGGNMRAVTNDTYVLVGQNQTDSGTYFVRQNFLGFAYTYTAGQTVVAGHFSFDNSNTHGTSISRDLEIRKFDYSTSVDTLDWRSPSQLSALPFSGRLRLSNNNLVGQNLRIGYRIPTDLDASSTLRYVMHSSRNRLQNTPSTSEQNTISTPTNSDVTKRPQLLVGSTTTNMLNPLLAGQVQLSDGNWIGLERNSTTAGFTLSMRHITTSSDSVVWTAANAFTALTGSANMRGSHAISICRDNNDNLFVFHPDPTNNNYFVMRPFTKGVGNTWTEGTNQNLFTLEEDTGARIQQIACAWHDMLTGRIMVMYMKDWGVIGSYQTGWMLLDSAAALAGASSTSIIKGHESLGESGMTAYPAPIARYNPINSTGTLFDVHADPSKSYYGYFITGERTAVMGNNSAISATRYHIHSNGEKLASNTYAWMDTDGGYSVYDPDAKSRVIAIGSDQFVKITADSRSGYGLTIDRLSVPPAGGSFIRHAQIKMDAQAIAGFPTGSTLSTSMAWDAVYFPVDNSLWIYYIDSVTGSGRRLMRTAIRLSTDLPAATTTEVHAGLGASGETVYSLRVQRNRVVSDSVLIYAGIKSSGGTHAYQRVVDRINIAPTQPILNPVANYDASTAKDFTWTFSDPNIADNQTAYELQIVDVSDSSVDVSTGKVSSVNSTRSITANTIGNNKDFMWRVKTWDVADVESPWSDYSLFSTSNTGVVSITDPAIDNDPDIFTDDYLVVWDVAGALQDAYRVLITKTSDSSTFLDTGWVTSTAEQHQVNGFASDVEYNINVQTRKTLVNAVAADRLFTTHFSTVEQPIVTITPGVEYMNVQVENPTPRGDRPSPTVNRVYRRLAGDLGNFLYVGSCGPNETFRDYSVSSGEFYEYKVRAGVEA